MPVLDELPEPNAAHHGVLDRKSILRSTVPKRKGPASSKLTDFPENHTNHKFLDLIHYYECLDHRSSARPASKDKTTVPSSASTTPDLPEYESSSTGSRSTATPDFLFPKPSSVISDSDSRTDSPDLGYSSKRGSRQYEDNATSSSGSRNISPEHGFRNLISRHSEQKVKKSDSPDLGYATTPEKGPFKSYGDMRYLLDLKIPTPSDSESNSLPKSDLEKKPFGQDLEYKLDSRSNSEFNSSEKISEKYTDSLGQEMALESDGTSASKRSSFCIEELDPESFSDVEDFSFEVTLGKSSNHTQQMESLERRIGNMSSIIEHDDTLKNKCFDEEDSDNPDSMEKDTLNYTNLFEYEAPNNLEPDYARYKLAFDITESDFSANTPADDETDELTSRKFYSSRHKRLSQSTTDGYDGFRQRSPDSQSSDIVYDKDPNENTTLGNSQEFQYDGILDSKLGQNYPTYDYEPVNGLESTAIKLLEVEPRFDAGTKSGSSMSQYSDLKFDEYSNELCDLEKGIMKTSREVPGIRFPESMFEIDCEKGRPASALKDEDPKADRPEITTPDSMFSFACEDKPGSRMSNFSDGLNDEPKVNPDETKVKSSTEKPIEEVKEETEYNPLSSLDPRSDSRSSQVSFSLKFGPDEVRPDSRLSDTSCGFGLGKIPESYEPSKSPRLDYMPEPRTRYSMVDERTKEHRRSPDLIKGQPKGKRLSLDMGAVSKPVPHYMDNLFPTPGYRYSLPKPSDFLSDSFIKRESQSQNQSLNLSTESRLKVGSLNKSMDHSIERPTKPLNQSMNSSLGQIEPKRKAMRNFMSTCINESSANVSLADVSTASSIPPPLPSQPPPSLDEPGHHKMKIDLHTVDYIMNNRRRSCLKKDSSNTSKDFADEETYDDHNYSIVSLIGALEELGIEVEFNEPDEQHRRRTMGRNTSLMESVQEEDEEWNEERESAEKSKSKIGKHQLNEIEEADEIGAEVGKAPSPVFNTPTRLVHQPSEAEGTSSENKTEEIKTEDKFDLQTGTPKDVAFRLERPGSPVLSSSKKLKFLQRRSTEACKTNLGKVIEPQPSEPPQQNLESTRQLFVDSSVEICKLDNSISTISMTTSASREVSPVTETPQPSISKENCLAPTNLCKVLDAEDFKLSRNAEFDKIEKYAKVSTLRTGKVEKVKRNSFTKKYQRVNRKCKDTTTVESIPSVVENFLTDALGSEKDNYETTMVDDTFANTNDIEFTDSNLFTADESGTVDLDQSLRRSISDLALSAKSFLKNTTRKEKSSRRRWSELQEEMHVLLDSVSKQQLMIQQASKALKMCYTFKEFENSEEHVESERILLLAHKRKTAAMDAINQFAQQSKKLVYENYGDVTLNKIVLPLNTSEKYDKKNDSVEWYMVVIQNGLTVLGSQPVMRQKNSHEIIFPDPFFLPKVDPDFKLTFEIYRLKLKKKGGISHELKYHIRGSYSLADAWYKAISKLTQRSNPSKQNGIRLTKMFESSFMLIGQVEFNLKDLSRSSPWTLQEAHPILEGTIKMSFSCNVDLTESNSGWLTHGTDLKGYTVWNRRWCVLVGHVLKFWDYPTEDPEEKPIMELNLIHCKDSEIGVVDRELCAKPRTIMLEFDELKNVSDYDSTNDSNIREQRNFLTLDTNRDLDEWLTKINRVLQALKNWNAKC